jgi:hypothetical protein
MPLDLHAGSPTLLITKQAFERAGLTRAAIDERLGLTPDEFRVEGALIAVGPLQDEHVSSLIEELEGLGLVYFDDFFEMSGNWPDWLRVYVRAT